MFFKIQDQNLNFLSHFYLLKQKNLLPQCSFILSDLLHLDCKSNVVSWLCRSLFLLHPVFVRARHKQTHERSCSFCVSLSFSALLLKKPIVLGWLNGRMLVALAVGHFVFFCFFLKNYFPAHKKCHSASRSTAMGRTSFTGGAVHAESEHEDWKSPSILWTSLPRPSCFHLAQIQRGSSNLIKQTKTQNFVRLSFQALPPLLLWTVDPRSQSAVFRWDSKERINQENQCGPIDACKKKIKIQCFLLQPKQEDVFHFWPASTHRWRTPPVSLFIFSRL